MAKDYKLGAEKVAFGDISLQQATDEEGTSYLAVSLFGGREPGSGLAGRDFIQEVKELISERETIDKQDCLFYQELITVEGDYYLIREDRDLTPLIKYLADNDLQQATVIEWVKKLAAIYQQVEKAELAWPGVVLESLWVNQAGELVVVDPIVTERIIQYWPEVQWELEDMALKPPEVLKTETWTEESYVYTLGGLLYYLLTDQLPFVAETKEDLYAEIKHVLPREPRLLNEDIAPAVNELIINCLQKDKAERITELKVFSQQLAALERDNQLAATPEEKKELAAQKDKLEKWFTVKRTGILMGYKYWRHGIVGLLVLAAIIVLFSVGGYIPQVKADTPPQKVVNYFYKSIDTKNVNLLDEVLATEQVDYLEGMVIEGHVMETGRKMYGSANKSDSKQDRGQTDFVFSIQDLNITQVNKNPIKFRANYKFVFNDPKQGKLAADMEDYLILKQIEDKWKIVNIKGTITNSNFLAAAEKK